MREKYESLALTVLKELAKARGIKVTSAMKKADVVEAMLAKDEEEKNSAAVEPSDDNAEEKKASSKSKAAKTVKKEKTEKAEKPVKATTTEKLGFEGREEGISAHAICVTIRE